MQLMVKEDFLGAAKLFDSLISSQSVKNQDIQMMSFYNAGLAYKRAGDCERSLSRFRSVLDRSLKRFKEFQAISLLEISTVYECLGHNNQSLSSLKDLEGKLRYLNVSFQQVLYPARLSLAWAKQGNREKANRYQSLALDQLSNYRKSLREEELEKELARLFYLMGKSYVKKRYLQAESFVSSFLYHQLFLLQALVLKESHWSRVAKAELDKLFNYLEFVILQDKTKYKASIKEAMSVGLAFVTKMTDKEKGKVLREDYFQKTKRIEKLFQ